ncbi:MAG: polyprenol monophosphomannose synthase [Egibacteraceae bacterium]
MKSLVVIPTYNEVATLERITSLALRALPSLHVLIIDDASPDGTGELADRLAIGSPRVQVLHRTAKDGLGAAYRSGFAWGLERDYDALCQMDADLSHDPGDLPRLLAALDGADVAIGSRYVDGGSVVNWPLRRLVLSRAGNTYVRIVTGLPVRDATAGFRAFRADALRELHPASMKSEGYSFQLEMTLRAWQAGYTIVELPVVFTERREGASKMSRAIVAEALWRTASWGLRGRIRRRIGGST